ncbi:MAG: hypothetical protein HY645_13330 [Acidobacteria bacterium]|nr:hypothetical protein [Acidobacteriota bacterium]
MASCTKELDWIFEHEFEDAKLWARKEKDLIAELLSDLQEQEAEPRPFDIEHYFQERLEVSKRNVEQIRKEVDTRLEMYC